MAWAELTGQRAVGKNDTEGASFDLAYPGDVTAGSLICIGGGVWDTEGLVTLVDVTKQSGSAILDTITNNTSPAVSSSPGATNAYLSWARVIQSGSLIVRATPDSSSYINIAVTEFTGGDSSPLDVNGGGMKDEVANTTFLDTITTLTPNDLIVGVVVLQHIGGVPVTVGSGYIQIAEDETFTSSIFNMEYRIVTTPTTYDVNWSTSNTGCGYTIVNAAFKEAVAAGPAPIPARRLQSAMRW